MTEQTALVAGASRGLGLGLTRELLGRGWTVIATARRPDGASGLTELARAHPDRLRVESLDIDNGASVADLAGRLEETALDLLFVNAGVMEQAGLAELSPKAFATIMTTNALSPVQLAIALHDRVRDGGTVAFMSSRMGSIAEMTDGSSPAYRASKAALNALTRCLVAGLNGSKRTVLSFHPGWVRTDMGGPSAAVSVEDSVRGIANVIERERGSNRHSFLDYQGHAIPW